MFQYKVSVLLVVVAALVAISESGVVPENHFKFLGKFTPIQAKGARGLRTQSTSYYFLSQNAAAWSTAANDCRANLGDTASLVYIETDQELREVTSFLGNSDDTGSTYWTGGKYDSGRKTFVWDNGVEIGSFAPWAQGHPNTRTPVTRVLVNRVGGTSLRTDFQTASLRYICELTV